MMNQNRMSPVQLEPGAYGLDLLRLFFQLRDENSDLFSLLCDTCTLLSYFGVQLGKASLDVLGAPVISQTARPDFMSIKTLRAQFAVLIYKYWNRCVQINGRIIDISDVTAVVYFPYNTGDSTNASADTNHITRAVYVEPCL